MFTATTPATNKIVANLQTVEEALLAEAAGFRVEAHGRHDVEALAAAKIEQSPDYNIAPPVGEDWVTYTTKSGRKLVCEVIRLFAPDAEGYPQLAELVNPARPDNSFVAQCSGCKILDQDSISEDLLFALKNGIGAEDTEQPKKLKHGLRK